MAFGSIRGDILPDPGRHSAGNADIFYQELPQISATTKISLAASATPAHIAPIITWRYRATASPGHWANTLFLFLYRITGRQAKL